MTITEKLLNLSAKLLTTTDKKELLAISTKMTELAQQTLKTEAPDKTTGFLEFTQEEISKMPKNFRKVFILNGLTVHARKRRSGRSSYYEIRYRRDGYNITATGRIADIVKQKFIEKLSTAKPYQTKSKNTVKTIAEEWLACRKNYIQFTTYKMYASIINRFIFPSIGLRDITTIRSIDIIPIMQNLTARTYEDVRSVLNQIFGYAEKNGIISKNPVCIIEFRRSERKHGNALSAEEIKYFLQEIKKPQFSKYRDGLLLELYFGLRPCEVATAKIDGDFLVSKNAKRKKGRIEYKRIPITVNIAIPNVTNTERLNAAFKQIFPDKTQYSLRHTFATVCQQYVRREIVEVWLGDSSDRLIGQTYTHFPDNFMFDEMKKVRFPNP